MEVGHASVTAGQTLINASIHATTKLKSKILIFNVIYGLSVQLRKLMLFIPYLDHNDFPQGANCI